MNAATHWIFAYGSLIWRPGFAFIHTEPARVDGYHRALCVLSHKYRGTPECHGLVFGLDAGGVCHGLAYEVAGKDWSEVRRYLNDRELITDVYIERQLPVTLGASGRRVLATAYVVDSNHRQYVGGLPLAETLQYVRQGHGEAGSCVDYVRNTARHLHELGIPDLQLDELVRHL